MPTLEYGTVIRAVFDPIDVCTLKKEAIPLIGREGLFEALWKIDDGDYRGYWAMKIPRDWPIQTACWVPDCDLRPLREDKEGREPSR